MINKLILKGAIEGRTENQFLLGENYFYGVRCEQNYKLAGSWYKEAAKRGHAAAMYMYGYMAMFGLLGKTDIAEGTRYVKRAAAKGNLHAILLLARNYYDGFGVKKNDKKAFLFWKKGAELGCPEAEYYLGLCYEKGIYVRENILKSKRHLYNALENGYSLAKVAIGDDRRSA